MKKGTTMDMPGIMEEMFDIIEEHADVLGVEAELLMKKVYGQFPMKGHSEYTLADVFFPSAEFWAMRADITGIEVGKVYKLNALLKKLNYLPTQFGKGMSKASRISFFKYLRMRGVHIEKMDGRSGYYQVVAVHQDGIPYTEVFCDEDTPFVALAADYIASKTNNGKKNSIIYNVASIPNAIDDIQGTLKKMAKGNAYTGILTGDLATANRDKFVRKGFEKLADAGLLNLEEPRFVLVDSDGKYHRADEQSMLANYMFSEALVDLQKKGNYFRMPKRKYHLLKKMQRCPGLENVVDYYIERVGIVNSDFVFTALTHEEKILCVVDAHKHILERLEKRLHHHETCTVKKKCAPEKECITYREYYEMYLLLLAQKYPEHFDVASATT